MIKFIRYVQTAVPLCSAFAAVRDRLAVELGCRRNVYAFFKQLDQGNKGYLTAYDLQNGLYMEKDELRVTEHLMGMVANGLSYIEFSNLLFGELREQLPLCCGSRPKLRREATSLLKQLLLLECSYQQSMQTSTLAIRDMQFQAIYSTFNRIDQKQLQMINGEAFAHFMTTNTEQEYVAKEVEPFIIREFGSAVVSFPEFFEFFEKIKRRCRQLVRKRSERPQYEQPPEKRTSKKMVTFTNDVIRTASRRKDRSDSLKPKHKQSLRPFKHLQPQRKLATLSVLEDQHRPNRFLKYYRRGAVKKEAIRSCDRFLRTSPTNHQRSRYG